MKNKPKSFYAIAGSALAALLLVGTLSSATVFAAASPSSLPNTPAAVVSQDTKATETKTAKTEDPAKESSENAALAVQAKITEQQAIAAAKAANIGSTAGKASLESENGKTVYEVKLTSVDGKNLGVKVDAISGVVIAEADGNAEYEG